MSRVKEYVDWMLKMAKVMDDMNRGAGGTAEELRERWHDVWSAQPGMGHTDRADRIPQLDIPGRLDEPFSRYFDGMGVDQRAERAEAFEFEEAFEHQPTPEDLGLEVDDDFDR